MNPSLTLFDRQQAKAAAARAKGTPGCPICSGRGSTRQPGFLDLEAPLGMRAERGPDGRAIPCPLCVTHEAERDASPVKLRLWASLFKISADRDAIDAKDFAGRKNDTYGEFAVRAGIHAEAASAATEMAERLVGLAIERERGEAA